MESLARNHPFLDGNKRMAITAMSVFLRMNGFYLEVLQKELVRFSLDMAVGKLSDIEAVDWVKKHSTSEKK